MNQSLHEKLYNIKTPKRILSLDGGGVRGILTLGYLEKIEMLIRKKYNDNTLVLSDYYDLMGGTSAGAIICCCLATGKSVGSIIELYREFAREVFSQKRFALIPKNWKTTRAFLKASYKDKVLEKILMKNLKDIDGNDIVIGNQKSIKCGLVITSKRADTFSLWTFNNHPNDIHYEENKDLKLWELCRASSAAPYYFTPKKLTLRTKKGELFDAAFIDGGLSLANNPAFQLYLVSTISSYGFRWPLGEKNIYITSIGSGNAEKFEKVETVINRRALNWAALLPELFMTDASEMNEVILLLFGRNYGTWEIIDGQYKDLKDAHPMNEKFFSFVRFNAKLEEDLFENKGKRKNSLMEMDHYENIDELLEIGRKASKSLDDLELDDFF